MQLRMTAPMDIGLDLEDKGLDMGQEDIFDLETEEAARRNTKASRTAMNLMDTEDEESAGDAGEDEADEEMSEDERQEHKVRALEQELDGLYESYRERKSERDAKFKVKEARKKNKERDEEWTGFGPDGSDDADDDEESEEGGWEETAEAKARADEDSSEESDEEGFVGKKRQRNNVAQPLTSNKRAKLITNLDEPLSAAQLSKRAQVWFEQDMFKEMGDINIPADVQPAVEQTSNPENEASEGSTVDTADGVRSLHP